MLQGSLRNLRNMVMGLLGETSAPLLNGGQKHVGGTDELFLLHWKAKVISREGLLDHIVHLAIFS